MLINSLFYIIILFSPCFATNVLNLLDFAAPFFQMLNTIPEVCYEQLGCYRNDGLFGPSRTRPISVVPQSPKLIGTEYLIYSRKNPQNPQHIDAFDTNSLNEIEFDPKLNTKLIVHGFKEGIVFGNWQQVKIDAIKDGLLYNEDSNVFVIQWNRGAIGFYYQAVANCRVVATQIAQLINYLISERNAYSEQFHLIGFSLGAHIMGYVGQQIPNLGRITALDAAKPYFDGLSIEVRLDSSDALFVDALHTDNGIGTDASIGHIDVFVNNGNNQPGCEQQIANTIHSVGVLQGLSETISCDHKRSLAVYENFLFRDVRDCIPIAYKCESWERFQMGLCSKCGQYGEDCAIAGLNTDLNQFRETNSKFFLITSANKPFCVFQYLVQITTFTSTHQSIGRFFMRFYSSNESIDYESRNLKILPEEKASFVISNINQLNYVEKLDLIFMKTNLFGNDNSIVRVKSLKVTPLHIIDDQVKESYSKIYCTQTNDWTVMENKFIVTLNKNYCR